MVMNLDTWKNLFFPRDKKTFKNKKNLNVTIIGILIIAYLDHLQKTRN